jgi:hypothetical protein
MARIEVHPSDEFEVASAAGDSYTLVEYSTVHFTACENAPLQSHTTSKSYKLLSGTYVNRTGSDCFEVVGSGLKLTRCV